MAALENRVYIITGGSKGFGLAIAECLIQRGARVGLIGRNREHLEKAVAKLGENHAYAAVMDIASGADIATEFQEIRDHFGRLDGLINNAGLARPADITEMQEEEVAMQLNTNIMGTIFCSKAVVPLLAESDNPRIVNISSASAEHHDEMAHLSVYAASKAAVERLSRDMRRELQGSGIGVTILRPGSAATNFADGWHEQRFVDAMKAWQQHGSGMDTGMDASHVGDAVAYCLACPAGVSVDLLEIRPNTRVEKFVI